MLKKTLFGLIICGVVLTASGILLAGTGGRGAETSVSSVIRKQEVGNKICPVSGEKIDEKTKVTYEYQGKIYNLCCAGCIEDFRNNPDKYIKIIEKENKNK